MSETTEPDGKPEPGTGPSGVPDIPASPAPESTPPETDEPAPAKEAEEERESRGDKRIARMTALLSAAERKYTQYEQELEFYRRQAQQQPPADETPEQRYYRERAAIRAEVEAEIKVKSLHAEGYAQYADWDQRRNLVVKMGGDSEFANLIVDMPPREGVRVVAALAEDPEALQRIVNLEGAHRRALALGKYAATLEDAPSPRSNGAAPQVTRAPAPIRPVTGRASPQVNLYTMTGQQAVDYFMKENLEKRRVNR